METQDKVVGLRKSTVGLIGVMLVCAALGGLTGYFVNGGGFNLERASSRQEELIAQGRRIYRGNCAPCHGFRGQGGGMGGWGPPHNHTGHTWERADSELMSIVLEGRNRRMPAFQEQLTEEEIEAALTFIKTMWDDDQREYQRGLNP